MECKGHVFDIQSFSVHDGPGCRTTVFLTGCPLRCQWCANPESWVYGMHLMYAKNVCKWDKGCRVCAAACPEHAISVREAAPPEIDRSLCARCETFACTKICPNRALKQCVKEYSPEQLLAVLRRDMNHWGADGGVTFSGGDPLFQKEFLLEVLKGCQKYGIHTAVETSAHFPEKDFLAVMRYIHFAFIDVKNMDTQLHKEGTGRGNEQILSNIRALKKSGWDGRLVLRQPVIAGYNDSEENAKALIRFMQENDLFEINLLKFHRLGQTKWEQLGSDYAYAKKGDVTNEQLAGLQSLYLDARIACYVGNNTSF